MSLLYTALVVESSWNDVRERKWRGNWRMEWVASTLHTTSEHVVSSITTADAHTSAASSRLNWRPRPFKLALPFRRKTKSGFCTCTITFQMLSNTGICVPITFGRNHGNCSCQFGWPRTCKFASRLHCLKHPVQYTCIKKSLLFHLHFI